MEVNFQIYHDGAEKRAMKEESLEVNFQIYHNGAGKCAMKEESMKRDRKEAGIMNTPEKPAAAEAYGEAESGKQLDAAEADRGAESGKQPDAAESDRGVKSRELSEVGGGADFDFMKEQIKERPLNKRKLLRRTVLTAAMAVLFGLIACLTILLLEPVFSNWLHPEEPAENITFPPETQEMLPEDMALDDTELELENEVAEEAEEAETEETDELDIYRNIYKRLQTLSEEVSKCMVTVTGVTSDTDWFDNRYESRGQTAGLIVADNGKEHLVLADAEPLQTVETINITFCDNSQVQAQIKMTDPVTGLAILSIDDKDIREETLDQIGQAELGSSNYASLTGSPVIALGSPSGVSGSVIYGVATSSRNPLNTVDSRYTLITTDIYGSSDGTGALVNLQGQVIGIIDQSYNDSGMENMIAAIGISELKTTIERMSNGKAQAYMGIYGADVSPEANENQGVPFGAYVTEIEIDSPAMQAGIQGGDVLISLDGSRVEDYGEYIEALSECTPDSTVNVTLMRRSQDEYKSMSIQVALGKAE